MWSSYLILCFYHFIKDFISNWKCTAKEAAPWRESHKVLLDSEVAHQMCSQKKVLWKYAERTTMPKSDFNKVAKQLYLNLNLAWVLSCKFAAYFQNTFSWSGAYLRRNVPATARPAKCLSIWDDFNFGLHEMVRPDLQGWICHVVLFWV